MGRKAHSTSGQAVRRIPCNHTPRPSDLPSRRRESSLPDVTRNTPMIEPPKATKGRRMSKKSRKKSPSASSRQKVAAKSSKGSKARARKARRPAAKTSNKKSNAKRSGKPSHKPASKGLKSPSSAAAALAERTHALTEGAMAPDFHLPRDGGG